MDLNHLKLVSMNLNHRIADGRLAKLDIAIHKLSAPVTWLIPITILGLSFYTAIPNFGHKGAGSNFTTGLLPFITNAIATLFRTETIRVETWIILLGYLIGPVVFYFFVYFFTKRHLPAILTALLTILPINPVSNSPSERLVLALADKDGAHILGLSVIPLLSLIFLRYQRTGQKKDLFWFGLIASGLSTISFFSLFILAIFMLFISISEALTDQGRVKLKRWFIGMVVLLAIIGGIYNTMLWRLIISDEGRTLLAVLINLAPLSCFIVPVLGTFAFLIFDRRPKLQPLFLCLTLSVTFGLLHWVRVSFVDIPILQYDRYAAELSFVLAFFFGLLIMWWFDLVRAGKVINRFALLYTWRNYIAFGFVSLVMTILILSILFISRSV